MEEDFLRFIAVANYTSIGRFLVGELSFYILKGRAWSGEDKFYAIRVDSRFGGYANDREENSRIVNWENYLYYLWDEKGTGSFLSKEDILNAALQGHLHVVNEGRVL